MKYTLVQSICWILTFLGLSLLPMAVGLAGPLPAGRGFWIEFGVMIGFLGLGILSLQCVISGRYNWFGAGFGFDNLLEFHKWVGVFAMLLVLAHPAMLISADREFFEFYDPRENAPRAIALWFVTIAILSLISSSLWRGFFRLSYERWRLVHGVLTLGIIFFALGHVVMVDHYGQPFWKKAFFALTSGAALYLVLHSRVIRPALMRRRPYTVTEVREQRNHSRTLVIRAVGHEGMQHRAGQFLWVTLGNSPYSLEQHPYSIASSPLSDQIELTIKDLGDFSGSVKAIKPGTPAWLEGPYGCFYHEPDEVKGAVFIAGGVGVTPIMSMLRAARDRGDTTPYILLYGNTAWDDVMFREEIADMPGRISLNVVHVLTAPPDGWEGETGYIDAAVLDRHLPHDHENYAYFICGPGPLLDLVEPELRKRGIPAAAIHTERFDMV
jgi:predicted ferric reductase